jgi:pantoate--beta-alanine ligase
VLEGAIRPGHFAGVLTVVAKLFGLVRPDAAFFGEKDYQQLTLVRSMARELALPVEVVGVPTVREDDGLALSSRNRYLDPGQRAAAATISAALRAGAAAGPQGADAVLGAARAVLDACPDLLQDYLELTDTDLGPAPAAGPARLLVAVRAGSTRLLDNTDVRLGETDR